MAADAGSPDRIMRQSKGIALLLEQTSRLFYDRNPRELHAVQWAALRFFGRAGAQVRTVAGLARFLGVTAAPASRTASSLVSRGLLSVEKSRFDSRSKIFTLTETGHDILEDDPLEAVAQRISDLPELDRKRLASVLDQLYVQLSDNQD